MAVDFALGISVVLLLCGLIWAWRAALLKATAYSHMLRFSAWVTVTAGVVGTLAFSTLRHTTLGAEVGVDATIAAFALVLGVPVALAGSVYAILLAFRSIELTEKQALLAERQAVFEKQIHDDERSQNLEHLARSSGMLFAELAGSLERLNASSAIAYTESQVRVSELVRAGGDEPSRNAIFKNLNEVAFAYRDAWGDLLRHLRAIAQNPVALDLLDSQLASKQLASGLICQARRAKQAVVVKEWEEFLEYGESGASHSSALSLLSTVQVLHGQAGKLTYIDLIEMVIRTNLNVEASTALEFSVAKSPDLSWLDRRQPTRSEVRTAALMPPALMLLDLEVGLLKPPSTAKVLGVGEMVLADLIAAVPTKEEITTFFEGAISSPPASLVTLIPEDRQQLRSFAGSLQYPQANPVGRALNAWSMRRTAHEDVLLRSSLHHHVEALRDRIVLGARLQESWRSSVRRHVVAERLPAQVEKLLRENRRADASSLIEKLAGYAHLDGAQDEVTLAYLLLAARHHPEQAESLLLRALDLSAEISSGSSHDVTSLVEATGTLEKQNSRTTTDLRLSSSSILPALTAWLAYQFRPFKIALTQNGERIHFDLDDVVSPSDLLPMFLRLLSEYARGHLLVSFEETDGALLRESARDAVLSVGGEASLIAGLKRMLAEIVVRDDSTSQPTIDLTDWFEAYSKLAPHMFSTD